MDIEELVHERSRELVESLVDYVTERTKLKKEDFIEIFKAVEIIVDKKISQTLNETEDLIDRKLLDAFTKLADMVSKSQD